MMFMNAYEIAEMLHRTDRPGLETAHAGADALASLAEWADQYSDGWCYWPKPARAAKSLQELLQSVDRYDPEDIAPEDLAKALRPVKAFLTRQGVDHSAILG